MSETQPRNPLQEEQLKLLNSLLQELDESEKSAIRTLYEHIQKHGPINTLTTEEREILIKLLPQDKMNSAFADTYRPSATVNDDGRRTEHEGPDFSGQ